MTTWATDRTTEYIGMDVATGTRSFSVNCATDDDGNVYVLSMDVNGDQPPPAAEYPPRRHGRRILVR